MGSSKSAHVVPSSDGTDIYYERFGCGLPVVLCDGLACSGYVWNYLIPVFAAQFDLIHWHYPGHGRSSVPGKKANLSMGRLADDLALLLAHADVGPAVIIGHSLGVQVALETWRRHPENVRALVLLCGVSGHLIKSIDKGSILRFLIPSLWVAELFFPSAAADLFHKLPSKILAKAALWSSEINTRLIRTPDLDAYFDGIKSVDFGTAVRMARFATAHDATGYLPEVTVPALVMGGRLDKFTPAVRLEEMAAALSHAELTITRRGSHALPVEQPDFVNLRIQRFLEERVWGGY